MTKRKIATKFTSREFNSIKQDLLNIAKNYYPNNARDFSEASFGSFILDSVAYVGDILSYYTDYSANEAFLDTAIEYNNIIKHGKAKGYKFRAVPSSFGMVTVYIVVPSKSLGLGPDLTYVPILRKGSEFSSTSGGNFILNEDINFSKSSNEVVVAEVDPNTGIPTSYAIKAKGQVISGELTRQTFEVGDFIKFLRISLSGDNISEVISVFDSEGHEYVEVEYLSQNVIYKAIPNFGSNRDTVSSILKPYVAPRRFVVEQDANNTFLQFGFGSVEEIKINPVVDPAKFVLQLHGKDYFTDRSFDPNNLISSDKFGVVPVNTILTIITRNNTLNNVNASVGTIVEVGNPQFEFSNPASLNRGLLSNVMESLEITNEEPVVGDISVLTSEELKRRVYDVFASQNRAVTATDYASICYQMPPKFGSVKKVGVVKDINSLKRNINLYVISESENGTLLPANTTLKQNLKVWLEQYKMLHDEIQILDAKIYNLGISFEAIVDEEKNRFSALSEAILLLKDRYIASSDIGESFSISDVYSTLKKVTNIIDVLSVKVINKTGGVYSNNKINVDNNMSPDGREILVPEGGVYEIKILNQDIVGTIR